MSFSDSGDELISSLEPDGMIVVRQILDNILNEVEAQFEHSEDNDGVNQDITDVVGEIRNGCEQFHNTKTVGQELSDTVDVVRQVLDDIINEVEAQFEHSENNDNVNQEVKGGVDEVQNVKFQNDNSAASMSEISVSTSDESIPLAKLTEKKNGHTRRRRRKHSQKTSVSEYNTSDEEPLAKHIKPHESDISDISDNDPTYKLSKKDLNSSDSEYNEDRQSVISLKKAKSSKSTKCYMSRKSTTGDKLTEVKRISRQETQSIQDKLNVHLARLDNLMTSNGLKRIPVAADGNCFFEAISHHVSLTSKQIRAKVCDLLENDYADYIQFVQADPDDDDNSLYLKYFCNVNALRLSGVWDSDIRDILPLAIANLLNRKITIYSSRLSHPVLEVDPDNIECNVPITLALTSATDVPQHYDACVKNPDRSNIQSKCTGDVNINSPSVPVPQYIAGIRQPQQGSFVANNDTTSRSTQCTKVTPTAEEKQEPSGQSGASEMHASEQTNTDGSFSNDNSTTASTSILSNILLINSDIDAISCQSGDIHVETEASLPQTPNDKTPVNHSTPTHGRKILKLPTPRKKALYMTPPKKQLFRRRSRMPDTWKRNVNKRLKLSGQEYTDSKGHLRKAKGIQTVDCSKCKFKCSQHISEDKRKELFDEFYSLDSYERQKDFICSNTTEKPTLTILGEDNKPVSKKRNTARSYTFTVDGTRIKVCKSFFRKSVGVSYIEHALQNSGHGSFNCLERRGRHSPANKTKQTCKQDVKKHIQSFPAVDPHYTRRDSTRQYLDQGLSINKMYALYKEDCEKTGKIPVTSGIYRKVFVEEYNLSFHKPKKDQCLLCSKYHQEMADKGHVEPNLLKKYEEHQERKIQSRQEKEGDKQKAQKCNKLNVVTFDLQAVLSTPCSLVSQVFYKRKLNTYNLSVYSLADNKGYNYVWDETEGKRGSNEISTCLYLYLSSLPPAVDTVYLYSDTCSGQNRNQHTAAELHHAVTRSPYLTEVNQKFLESGHTQMECDSMHAAIEHAKKRTSVFVPSQWDTVIQMARQKQPYKVIPLKHSNFWDFKKISKEHFKSSLTDNTGKRVKWMKIKWLKFKKGETDKIFFKYSFSDEEFLTMKLSSGLRRGRPKPMLKELQHLYEEKLPISDSKKKDLLDLCASRVIPGPYHDFYKSLPSLSKTDQLPEPDQLEEDTDTDN